MGKKTSPVIQTLQRQLWPDSVTDFLLCTGYGAFFMVFCLGTVIARIPIAAVVTFALSVVLIVAGVGLKRERRWAANVASVVFFLTGFWLVGFHFQNRANELGRPER
ncbi:MAG: hypothetical protein JST30_12690 [Armatimonadetes bacterium]|nr:hypothetical protein [Armatimonadota bacterium]